MCPQPLHGSESQWQADAQKITHDQHVKNRKFVVDDPVFVCHFATSGSTRSPGIIDEARRGLIFHVEMSDGRIFCRHIDDTKNTNIYAGCTAQLVLLQLFGLNM